MITGTILVLVLVLAGILWNAWSDSDSAASPADSSEPASPSATSSPSPSPTFTVPPRDGEYDDLPDLCEIDVSALGDWVTEDLEGHPPRVSIDDATCIFSEKTTNGFQYLQLSASVYDDLADARSAFWSFYSTYEDGTAYSVDGKYIELGDYSFAAYVRGDSGSLQYFVYTFSGNLTITTNLSFSCPDDDSSCYDLTEVKERAIALTSTAFESIPPAS